MRYETGVKGDKTISIPRNRGQYHVIVAYNLQSGFLKSGRSIGFNLFYSILFSFLFFSFYFFAEVMELHHILNLITRGPFVTFMKRNVGK